MERWGLVIFQGQFFEEWNEEVHAVDDFPIPNNWQKQIGLDIGYTTKHPTVCLWGAQDPETLDIYIYKEYTGKPGNEGGCDELYAKTIQVMMAGEEVPLCWADPSAFNKNSRHEHVSESTAFYFMREGLVLQRASNDRINGWRATKQWLHWHGRKSPKLKFFRSCYKTIQALPSMRYNTRATTNLEDLDTTQSLDDYADALRYMVHSGFIYPGPSYMQEHDSAILDGRIYLEPEKGEEMSHTFVNTAGITMTDEEAMAAYLNTDRNKAAKPVDKVIEYEEEEYAIASRFV